MTSQYLKEFEQLWRGRKDNNSLQLDLSEEFIQKYKDTIQDHSGINITEYKDCLVIWSALIESYFVLTRNLGLKSVLTEEKKDGRKRE